MKTKAKAPKFSEPSMDEIRTEISRSLASGWVQEMYRDFAIVRKDEELFKLPYSIDDAGNVTLGTMEAVEVEYVPTTQMADFNSSWVEIFRAGDYGKKGVWTKDQIDQVVSNFSAGIWTPPAVIGHPETDSPAMGWVKELKRDGETLQAKFNQVQPELEGLVSGGRFPNRSAAFYSDPQGKGPVLRHVGFLGAVPPEVKGLAPVKFSQETFTSIDFQEEQSMDEATIKKTVGEQIKAYFADMFGPKRPEGGQFSEEQVNAMLSKAVTAATAPLNQKLDTMTTQFGELKNELKTATTDNRKSKAQAFIDKMKAAGKWVPAFTEMGMEALLEQAATSGAVVKFGETGKEKESGSFETMCAFLESHGKIVPTDKLTSKLKVAGKVVRFNEAEGVDLDQDSVLLNELTEKISREQKITFAEALPLAMAQTENSGAA